MADMSGDESAAGTEDAPWKVDAEPGVDHDKSQCNTCIISFSGRKIESSVSNCFSEIDFLSGS